MQQSTDIKASGNFEKINPEILQQFKSGVLCVNFGNLKTKKNQGKEVNWGQGDDLFVSTLRHGKIKIKHKSVENFKHIQVQPTVKSQLLDWLESIGFALFWFAVISTWILASFVVPTASMTPNLEVGDKLFGLKTYYFSDPPIGSMVIFEPPISIKQMNGELWVKRIIAGPGDIVAIDQGYVYVNGVLINEIYASGQKTSAYTGRYNEGFSDGPDMKEVRREWIIPKKGNPDSGWFVLGDNRENSFDSRAFGLVPDENIRGKPWVIWSPLSKFGSIPNLNSK